MVGATRELREIIQGYDPNLLRDFCAKTGTQWIFTTPAAPHQNGVQKLQTGHKESHWRTSSFSIQAIHVLHVDR